MAVSKTSRFGLNRWDSGGDPYNRALHDGDNAQIESLGVVWREGDDAAKGVASAAQYVRSFYYARDLDVLYWSNGTTWVTVNDYGESGDIQALRTGSAASAGSITTSGGVTYAEVALANHVHPMGTPAAAQSVGVANSAGTVSGAVFAAEDHVHRLGAGSIDNTTLFGTAIIPAAALANLAVTTAKLDDLSVTTAKLANAAVTGAKIASTTIVESNIADGAITSAKIAAGAVVDADLGLLAVTTTKINDLAVTTGKLADGAVTSAKIADGTITGTDIASATVTGSNIAASTITASNIAAGTITSANILDGTITSTDIAAGTITSGNILDGTITLADLATALQNLLVPAGTVAATAASTAPSGWFFFNQTIANAQSLYPSAWSAVPAIWKSGSSIVLPNVDDATIAQFAATALGVVAGSNTTVITASNLPLHVHGMGHGHTTGGNTGTTGDQNQSHYHDNTHGHGISVTVNAHTDLVTRLTTLTDGAFVTGNATTPAYAVNPPIMAMNSGLVAPLVGMAVSYGNPAHTVSASVTNHAGNTNWTSGGHNHNVAVDAHAGNTTDGGFANTATSTRNKHLALNLMIKIH